MSSSSELDELGKERPVEEVHASEAMGPARDPLVLGRDRSGVRTRHEIVGHRYRHHLVFLPVHDEQRWVAGRDLIRVDEDAAPETPDEPERWRRHAMIVQRVRDVSCRDGASRRTHQTKPIAVDPELVGPTAEVLDRRERVIDRGNDHGRDRNTWQHVHQMSELWGRLGILVKESVVDAGNSDRSRGERVGNAHHLGIATRLAAEPTSVDEHDRWPSTGRRSVWQVEIERESSVAVEELLRHAAHAASR